MAPPLCILIVDDSEDDALLVARALRARRESVVCERVETAEAMRDALINGGVWDAVLCDHSMPNFDVVHALGILRELHLDLPFIVVSGAVGEERAAELMRFGAHDLVLKSNLSRLAPRSTGSLEKPATGVNATAWNGSCGIPSANIATCTTRRPCC